jgi:hypothetical protein
MSTVEAFHVELERVRASHRQTSTRVRCANYHAPPPLFLTRRKSYTVCSAPNCRELQFSLGTWQSGLVGQWSPTRTGPGLGSLTMRRTGLRDAAGTLNSRTEEKGKGREDFPIRTLRRVGPLSNRARRHAGRSPLTSCHWQVAPRRPNGHGLERAMKIAAVATPPSSSNFKRGPVRSRVASE